MRPIKTRLEALEGESAKADYSSHDYEAVIPFGEPINDQGPKYYRDGVEISREQYQAEAPRDPNIEIVLGPAIPPRESTD